MFVGGCHQHPYGQSQIGEEYGTSEFKKTFRVSTLDTDKLGHILTPEMQRRCLELDPVLYPDLGEPLIVIDKEKVTAKISYSNSDKESLKTLISLISSFSDKIKS